MKWAHVFVRPTERCTDEANLEGQLRIAGNCLKTLGLSSGFDKMIAEF